MASRADGLTHRPDPESTTSTAPLAVRLFPATGGASVARRGLSRTIALAAAREHFLARSLRGWMVQRSTDFSPTHAFFASMDGFRDGYNGLHPVSFKQMIELIPSEDIRNIRWIDLEDTIRERSQFDLLLLLRSCNCYGWASRRSLPISTLEIRTCAHALCRVPVYIPRWSKPLNIRETFD